MKYVLEFSKESEVDIAKIKKSGDQVLFKKLSNLLMEISEHPKIGTGQP